jgi:Derlin-2/3
MPFAQPVQGVADAAGPDQWFKSLPVVTRYWFGATIAVTLAANFEIISSGQCAFVWPLVRYKFELWRLLSCFLYAGPFSMNTMISCYMLVTFSRQYEAGGPYNTGAGGGTADFAFMLMFGAAIMLITFPLVTAILGLPPIFCQNMISYVLYTWSRRNPTAQANIWGMPVPGAYLPFAHLALTVFMGNPYADQLHGLMCGHIYYFLVDVVPQVQGKDILHTPRFLIDAFGIGEYRPTVEAVAPPQGGGARIAGLGNAAPAQNTAAVGGGGYTWGGGGRPLGRD